MLWTEYSSDFENSKGNTPMDKRIVPKNLQQLLNEDKKKYELNKEIQQKDKGNDKDKDINNWSNFFYNFNKVF